MTTPTPVLDVVIPVYNEQVTLGPCVRRLVGHLSQTFPYPFRVTVADNASTDSTWQVATELEQQLGVVRAVHLGEKGRGRALKKVWLESDAAVLAYMDVDLSTDLDALWPLVAPLMSGHSDLAIGSRLSRQSRVERGPRRELISRCYNVILRTALGVGFSDAQCGFKAIRGDVARRLLPLVEDTAWFFDTELLVLAERSGLRIHEVPVDWYDDPDSRVDVVRTATDDLRGVWRVRRAIASGRLPLDQINHEMGRRRPGAGLTTQLARFATIGVASTALHLGMFALLTDRIGPQGANLLALLVSTVFNTAANRAWTFEVRGRDRALTHQLQGLAVFAITWGGTALALSVLRAIDPAASAGLQTAVVAVATAISTVVRFAALRRWMGPQDNGFYLPEPVAAEDHPELRVA